MKAIVVSVVLLLLPVTLVGQQESPKDKDAAQELDAKIKALREQIEELKKKQEDLQKQQADLVAKKAEAARKEAERKRKEIEARRAKEEAAKKIHYAKMEIRGTLVKDHLTGPKAWHVIINELRWTLDFGDKKDLVAQAEKLTGEGVVITGKVLPKRPAGQPYIWPGTGWPTQPRPVQPGQPLPNRWPQDWNPGYGPVVYDNLIVQVDSIVAAKD